MAALNANSYYQQQQVTTASRGQLLVLAYDGAIRFLAEGRRAMAVQDYERQNLNLQKAQAILLELRFSLDHSMAPELCASLDGLYRYMHTRLMHANTADDQQALLEVAGMLGELRDTWAEADLLARNEKPALVTAG